MNCIICDGTEKEKFMYADEKLLISSALEPSTLGHLQLWPKAHYNILEQVPDTELSNFIGIANKLSMLLFQLMRAEGTNILIQNGLPAGQTIAHFSIHVLPRKEGDGITLSWNPKKSSNEDLEYAMNKIKDALIIAEDVPTTPKQATEKKPEVLKTSKDNYLIKQLTRMP
jgi:histidine triad (HIT) family protein